MILKQLVKNFSILSIGQIIAGLLNFLAMIVLARRLGVEGFGIFGFAESIFLFFLMFVIFGTDFLGSRNVAQDEKGLGRHVDDIVSLRILISLISFLLLLIFVIFLKKSALVKMTVFIFGLSLFSTVILLNWLFLGTQKVFISSVSDIIRQVVFFLGIIIFVKQPRDILLAAFCFLASRFLQSFYLWIVYAKKHGALHWSLRWSVIKKLLGESFPIFFSTLEGWIITSFDIFFIGVYLGTDRVGYYNAAFKPVFLLIGFCMTFYLAMFPILSKAYKKNMDEFLSLIKYTVYGMMGFWLPFVLLGYQLAKPIMKMLYGDLYLTSVPLFKVFIISLIIIPLNTLYSRCLISSGKQKENSYVSAFIIIINLVLFIFLIPIYGLMGAAYAKIITWILAFFAYCYFLSREIHFSLWRSLSGPAFATGAMILIFFMLQRAVFWQRLSAAIFVYSIVFCFFTLSLLKKQKSRRMISP